MFGGFVILETITKRLQKQINIYSWNIFKGERKVKREGERKIHFLGGYGVLMFENKKFLGAEKGKRWWRVLSVSPNLLPVLPEHKSRLQSQSPLWLGHGVQGNGAAQGVTSLVPGLQGVGMPPPYFSSLPPSWKLCKPVNRFNCACDNPS